MAAPIAHVLVRWHRSRLAETDPSDLVSAARHRLTTDIDIAPIVVAELKFRDIATTRLPEIWGR
jgi:hypothetical protein